MANQYGPVTNEAVRFGHVCKNRGFSKTSVMSRPPTPSQVPAENDLRHTSGITFNNSPVGHC
jgi:hypothetical protein